MKIQTVKWHMCLWISVLTVLFPSAAHSQIGPEQIISNPAFPGTSVIHVADLNGDGFDDVITAKDFEIVYWAGTGTGKHAGPSPITTECGQALAVYTKDVDADLDLDVVVAWNVLAGFCSNIIDDAAGSSIPPPPAPRYFGNVSVIENLGAGQFGVAQHVDSLLPLAQSVFAIDLDGDEDNDLLFGGIDSPCTNDSLGLISWYQNDGAGIFGQRQALTQPTDSVMAFVVRTADLDGDLDNDIIATMNKDNRVFWFENLGAGSFGPQQAIDSALAYGCSRMELVDLDGDLDTDLLLGFYDEVFWLPNVNGAFTAHEMISMDVDNIKSVYPADLDNDGDMDVISASSFDTKIAWYENDGTGLFGMQNVADATASNVSLALPMDEDLDGNMEIVALGNGGLVSWQRNLTNGQFGISQMIASLYGPTDALANDLDDDGDMDVLVTNQNGAYVLVYKNLGSNFFSEAFVLDRTLGSARSVAVADLDVDGDMDAIVAANGGNRVVWYENMGNLNFSLAQVISNTAGTPWDVEVVDMDNDQLPDVVVTQNVSDRVVWYKNLGSGVLGTEQVIGAGIDGARGLSIADLDGDSDPDVVVAAYNGDLVLHFENLGGGTFSAQQILDPIADQASAVAATDLDTDGDLDIVSSSYGSLRWIENTGTGTFNSPVQLNSYTTISIASTDINSDTHTDLLLGGYSSSIPSNLYLNDGTPTLSAPQPLGSLTGYVYLSVADMDNDTDPDIIASAYNLSRVSWFENQYLLIADQGLDRSPSSNVYPNPTDGACIIELSTPAMVRVFDAQGRLVLSKQCSRLAQLHFENSPAGLYLVHVEHESGTTTHKVMKH